MKSPAFSGKDDFHGFISSSPHFKEFQKQILKLAHQNTPVIISGEYGTGRKFVAHKIHNSSHRKTKPFITISCSAETKTRLDWNIPGNVKIVKINEYAPAVLEQLKEGTLFIRDFNKLDRAIQTQILRILHKKNLLLIIGLQQKSNVPNNPITDVSQPGNNLENKRNLKHFLKAFSIHIQPLRERPKVIVSLAQNYVQQRSPDLKKHIAYISIDAYCTLLTYDWPGNIPELHEALNIAISRSSGNVLTTDLLPIYMRDFLNFPQQVDAAYFLKQEARFQSGTILQIVRKRGWIKSAGN